MIKMSRLYLKKGGTSVQWEGSQREESSRRFRKLSVEGSDFGRIRCNPIIHLFK